MLKQIDPRRIFRNKLYWIVVVVLIIVTSAPVVYGFFSAQDGDTYSGIRRLTPGDTNTYLSMIDQSADGHFAFVNLYTSEDHPRIFVSPVWLVAGWISKIMGAGPVFGYHALRVLLIPFFVYLIFRLVLYVFPQRRRTQTVAILLVLFSTGLGAFLNPLLYDPNNVLEHPTDVWVPESITFLTIYHSPHFILSAGLVIAVLFLVLRGFCERQLKYILWAGLLSLVLFFIHPFYVATIFSVSLVWLFVHILKDRQYAFRFVLYYGVLLLAAIPAGLYYYWLQKQAAVYAAWATQNLLESPSVWMYVIGFGLLVPFAIFSMVKWFPQRTYQYLALWVIAVSLLLYAPVDFQRRLVEGIHVPLSILAAPAIVLTYDWLKQKKAVLATAFTMSLLLVLPLTNVQLVLQDAYLYATDKDYPFYVPEDELAAFSWLSEHAPHDAVILSSFYTGNFIPVYAKRRVFVGHIPQTVNYANKLSELDAFYDAAVDDAWKRHFIEERGITFIVYGKNERDAGSYNPADAAFLKEVFRQGNMVIFEPVGQ